MRKREETAIFGIGSQYVKFMGGKHLSESLSPCLSVTYLGSPTRRGAFPGASFKVVDFW